MHDCRLNGGHFFVLHPQISTYTCHRCRRLFHSRDPFSRSTIRSSASCTSIPASKPLSSSSAPWRCILESCNALACFSCADYVQSELCVLQKRILAAEASGDRIDTESAIREIEKAPHYGRRSGTRDGTISRSTTISRAPEPPAAWRAGVEGLRKGNGGGALELKEGGLEADDGESSDGADYDDYDAPVIPFRTAAMAAAAARIRAQNTGPRLGGLVAQREGKAVM